MKKDKKDPLIFKDKMDLNDNPYYLQSDEIPYDLNKFKNSEDAGIISAAGNNNFADENLKDEIVQISNALDEGTLNLSPEDEESLKKDIDAILNHIDLSVPEINMQGQSENQNIEDISKDEDFSFRDVLADNNNLEDNSFVVADEISADNNRGFDEIADGIIENVVEDLTVDDALSELIEDYSDDAVIKVENLSMDFRVSKDKIDSLKEFVIRTVKRNKSKSKTLRALDNISFSIPKGDRVGIIGFNGAGKSTLLKVLAGVYDPTEGNITTKGKIAPLLELGAGFDNNYTGKDNIFLNGAFLGYPEDFLKEKYDEILEFSELGDAINYHVKTYSSGMRAKLGFSIATIVEPDILIIDEILSVGDIKFRRKSADKIKSMINSGITVLLVSHSVNQIRDLCNKAIWIDEGKMKMYGDVDEVCDAYVKAASDATKDQLKNIELN